MCWSIAIGLSLGSHGGPALITVSPTTHLLSKPLEMARHAFLGQVILCHSKLWDNKVFHCSSFFWKESPTGLGNMRSRSHCNLPPLLAMCSCTHSLTSWPSVSSSVRQGSGLKGKYWVGGSSKIPFCLKFYSMNF